MDQMFKFAFFGTDEFSVKVLETLVKQGLKPSLIVTVPDKPKGRKMIMTPPLVKVWGEENGVEVVQPSSLKTRSDLGLTRGTTSGEKENFDFFLVASYGKIIPQEILNIPTHGTLNIHPSLLPKYRGPAPLETAILNGDDKMGVTIIKLDAEMDHGPILAQKSFDSRRQGSGQGIPLYNFEQLRDKTAEIGANLLTDILPDYLASKVTLENQDHDSATFTKKFVKADGELKSSDSALINHRKILALNPWPGTFIFYNNTRVSIKQAHLNEQGELVFDRVVPEGRKEMAWEDFLRGLNTQK